MGKPNYVCALCKKDFSRKSNANRHDLSQHQGLAQIIRVGDFKLKEKCIFVKANYNSNRPSYEDPKKARVFDTLEKLVPRFEEMEQTLSICSSEDKQKISGAAIIHAISSPDPIRSMNRSLDAIRKGSSIPKMINCVALSLGVTRTVAEEILASMVV
jgi:hypothetical protein